MNQEFKERWIAALLSGNYKQGMQQLRNEDNEFCCLGVACDINDSRKWVEHDESESVYAYTYVYDNERSSVELSDDMRIDIGLSLRDMAELISMNDSGKDFPTIATWINHYL